MALRKVCMKTILVPVFNFYLLLTRVKHCAVRWAHHEDIQQGALMPKEDLLEVRRKKGELLIGIPKETSFQERRVALVPEAVSLLVANGHQVLLESKAGEGAESGHQEHSRQAQPPRTIRR